MSGQVRNPTISNSPSKTINRRSTIESRQSQIPTSLVRWYRKNGRVLPWRGEADPYEILVSEVMLQQTQVSRVMQKFPVFLKRFPTLRKLARAKSSDAIRAWRGMGYNNRVLRLQQLARIIEQHFDGRLPERVEQLRELPGIGPYTAHAVACFAFGKQVPVVDTNIARVLHRLFPTNGGRRSPGSTKPGGAETWELAGRILPKNRAYEWNQALMDLGATLCTGRSPRCGLCPLQTLCPSAHTVRHDKRKPTRPERGRGGTPNRIFRGRIVEVLRNLNGRGSISSSLLAKSVKQDYQHRDRRWFTELLDNLERDGLVQLRKFKSGVRVSLPEK